MEWGITEHPHWNWYIVTYFFVGGIAAGAYFFAAILDFLGDPRDRPVIRHANLIAFPLVVVSLVCLILDLERPERFWHMLIMSERVPRPIFKFWSPMSVGAHALGIFAIFTFVSFVGVLVETGRIRTPWLVRLDAWARRRPRPATASWQLVGTFFGFFIAGYTGVLLTASNQPVWSQTNWLGALFLASAASTALATLWLLGHRRGEASPTSLVKLKDADTWAMFLELGLIVALVASLGAQGARLFTGFYGVLFWGGVVLLGVLVPLGLHLRPGLLGAALRPRSGVLAASLVLLGGLLLRYAVVYVVR